jgi:hypothetical protein
MTTTSFPSLPSRLRFALASVLVRYAFRVCPLVFAPRFIEETEEISQYKGELWADNDYIGNDDWSFHN